MPYQSIELDTNHIIYTRLIGEFTEQDITDYCHYLVHSDTYKSYGRLLVDYAEFEDTTVGFKELLELSQPMRDLRISDGVIWQAGINAKPVNIGVSRQANTILSMKNPSLVDVKLKFFDSRELAIQWLSSKPIAD